MEIKVCGRCHEVKWLSEFNKKATAKDGKQSYCRECNRARARRYYQENHDRHIRVVMAYRRRRKKELSARITAIKEANGCALCPENDPVCLEFHHPDPGQKDFEIGSFFNASWKWPVIVAEIKKCVVLCSNCHKKVHAGKRSVDPSRTCRVDMH
jgi:hypothetical protein